MRLDPRSPLVVNTHDLGRRAGAMRELTLTVPAPEHLGVEMLGVPPGSPVEIDLRLEAVMEGVLATAAVQAPLAGECVRCLEPVTDELSVGFQELYVYPESDAEEDEAARLDGELMDLEPALRDAVVLALPFQPVCRADCPGLCPECGIVLADAPGHRHEEDIDPRWRALAVTREAVPDLDVDLLGMENVADVHPANTPDGRTRDAAAAARQHEE